MTKPNQQPAIDDWPSGTRILVILAHPDDPEFFLGGSIAHWCAAGHEVHYGILTDGSRGVSEAYPDGESLKLVRDAEQRAAADTLGVKSVTWFGYPDGYLVPDLALRQKLVRFMRKMQPDLVVSCDPTNYYGSGSYLNHPDHRAAGQAVVDSIFPAVGNPSFFPELIAEGILPHQIQELWLSLTANPNIELDRSAYWDVRLQALECHSSQIGERMVFIERMQERRKALGDPEGRYIEKFRRIVLRR
jgi:LmbE family N-acetylglucosaminyl deacetylase